TSAARADPPVPSTTRPPRTSRSLIEPSQVTKTGKQLNNNTKKSACGSAGAGASGGLVAEHRYPERTGASPPGDHITVGLRVPHELPGGRAELRDYAARVEAAGVDRLFTGDHVTFRDGRGFDGLLTATALAVGAPRLTVQTAVYLLPLRHPVPVARQVTTL